MGRWTESNSTDDSFFPKSWIDIFFLFLPSYISARSAKEVL